MTETSRERRARQAIQRNILVVTLTLTTGAVDAVTFLYLGNVFSSVITGNMALLGVAAGSRNSALAVNGGVALAGYAIGALLAGAIARRHEDGQPVWPARVTAALAVELGVLAVFSAGWLLTSGRPGGISQLTLLSLTAAAMGMQSVAVQRLGRMSSTYLTSTLTGVIVALAVRQRPAEIHRSLGVFAAIVIGAVVGAITARHARELAPAAILIPITVVVVASTAGASLARRRSLAREPTHDSAVSDR